MPVGYVVALVVLLIATGALAWRYLALRRRIDEFARRLRQDPQALPPPTPELEALLGGVQAVVASFGRQLADQSREGGRLRAALDQMTDGVMIADADGSVRFANPAARTFFSVPEPVGRSVVQMLRNHQLIAVWRRCQQTRQLQTESVEIPIRQQFLQLVAIPDEESSGCVLLIQDLTRVRRLETVRRDFVSNVSHELRTPLASLKALTETLQDGALQDPDAGPRFLERIITEVDALTQMAQELLDLSRIESGQDVPELAGLAPQQLVASVVDRMKVQSERGGVALRGECTADLPQVRGDAVRLEQVLVNLVHNAIKFTDPGGEVVVSAGMPKDGELSKAIRFTVLDTGRGIPADELPRIFERFYRVDKARSRGGTGLGLAIARHIVEAHGGTIWAESVEGRGSTFYFTIPIAK